MEAPKCFYLHLGRITCIFFKHGPQEPGVRALRQLSIPQSEQQCVLFSPFFNVFCNIYFFVLPPMPLRRPPTKGYASSHDTNLGTHRGTKESSVKAGETELGQRQN
jgi:hypothetical protein